MKKILAFLFTRAKCIQTSHNISNQPFHMYPKEAPFT